MRQNLRRCAKSRSPFKFSPSLYSSCIYPESKVSLSKSISPCSKNLQISSEALQIDPKGLIYKSKSSDSSRIYLTGDNDSNVLKENKNARKSTKINPHIQVPNSNSQSSINGSENRKDLAFLRKRILMKIDWTETSSSNPKRMKFLTQKYDSWDIDIVDGSNTKKIISSPLVANEYDDRKDCKRKFDIDLDIACDSKNSLSVCASSEQDKEARSLSVNSRELGVTSLMKYSTGQDEFKKNSNYSPNSSKLDKLTSKTYTKI